MKVWSGYGSEHSMNLVMIGRFKDGTAAARAKALIDQLTDQVTVEIDAGRMTLGEQRDHFTDQMLDLLMRLNVASISPMELEQFAYQVDVTMKGTEIVVRTDEIDVSAFLKILLEKGARVELFSAHEYAEGGVPAQ